MVVVKVSVIFRSTKEIVSIDFAFIKWLLLSISHNSWLSLFFFSLERLEFELTLYRVGTNTTKNLAICSKQFCQSPTMTGTFTSALKGWRVHGLVIRCYRNNHWIMVSISGLGKGTVSKEPHFTLLRSTQPTKMSMVMMYCLTTPPHTHTHIYLNTLVNYEMETGETALLLCTIMSSKWWWGKEWKLKLTSVGPKLTTQRIRTNTIRHSAQHSHPSLDLLP